MESDAIYGVGKFEGGSYFWKGGSRKGGGVRTNPPNPPPGYGPDIEVSSGMSRSCWDKQPNRLFLLK